MDSHILAFEVKLGMWEALLAAGQFIHFPCIAACAPDEMDLNSCVSVVTSLQEEFASRFTCRATDSGLQALHLLI